MTDRDQFKLMGDDALIETLLAGWHTLNPVVTQLDQRQLAVLIQAELRGKRREPLLQRLHQRYCRVRGKREWRSIRKAVESDKELSTKEIEWLR